MSTRKKANNFLLHGSILAIASIIVRLIGVLYRVPLTEIIGDEGMGYYSVAFEIYGIALILSSYSIPLAVSKLVVARNAKGEFKNSYKIFKGALLFAFISGTIAALLIFFGAEFFVSKSPRSALPLKALAPTILIVAVMGVFRGYYQGIRTMIPTSFSQVLEQIINAFVSVYAAYFLMKSFSASIDIAAYGALGGTIGTGAGALAGLLFLLFVFVIYRPVIKRRSRKDHSENVEDYKTIFKIIIFTTMPVILSTAVYNISGVIDITLFNNILSQKGMSQEETSSLLGIFANKYRVLTNVPIAIASAVAAAMIPTITAAFTNEEMGDVKDKVQSSIKFCMIVAIPSAVGIGVLASPILKLLFSDGRALPANLISIGAISIVFFSLSTVTNAVLQGINKMKLPVIHSAISLGIHIIIVVVLLIAFNFNVYALVIGNVIFALIVCILNQISIRKYLGYKQEIVKTFAIPSASAAVMGVFTFLTYFLFMKLIKINSISTLFAVVVAVITYFVMMLLLKGITQEELKIFPKGDVLIKIAKKVRLLK